MSASKATPPPPVSIASKEAFWPLDELKAACGGELPPGLTRVSIVHGACDAHDPAGPAA